MLYSKIEGAGNTKKLVIIHGFLGMSDNWKSMAIKWAEIGFEVHSVDLRNHGRSFHSEDFSYEIMANDLKEYFDFHQLNQAAVLGHSMGGKTAMLFATLYPELVKKLIIADIAPKYYPQHHQNILKGLNAIDFKNISNRNEVESILAQYIAEAGTRQFLMKNLYWVTPEQLGFRFNLKVLTDKIEEIGKALPYENQFNGTTLFLRGELSLYIIDEDWHTVKHHFPNATLKTIPSAGHWLHAENPAVFYQECVSFLLE